MTREIEEHRGPEPSSANALLRVQAADQPDASGANAGYDVLAMSGGEWQKLARVQFHRGEVTNQGPRGVTNEVLLAVVLDRLRAWQNGPMASADNGKAIANLEAALASLHRRTKARKKRGVEGKAIP